MTDKIIEIHPESLEVTHEGVFEGKVTAYGNSAKVIISKKHIGKRVYIAIIKE